MDLWTTWNGETVYHLSAGDRRVLCGTVIPGQISVKWGTSLYVDNKPCPACLRCQSVQGATKDAINKPPTAPVAATYITCRFCKCQVDQQCIADHMNSCAKYISSMNRRKRKKQNKPPALPQYIICGYCRSEIEEHYFAEHLGSCNKYLARNDEKPKSNGQLSSNQKRLAGVLSEKEKQEYYAQMQAEAKRKAELMARTDHASDGVKHETNRPWFRGNPTHRRTEET